MLPAAREKTRRTQGPNCSTTAKKSYYNLIKETSQQKGRPLKIICD